MYKKQIVRNKVSRRKAQAIHTASPLQWAKNVLPKGHKKVANGFEQATSGYRSERANQFTAAVPMCFYQTFKDSNESMLVPGTSLGQPQTLWPQVSVPNPASFSAPRLGRGFRR